MRNPSGIPDFKSGSIKEFHKRFAHLRQHGEWFTPAPELLEFIKEL